MIATVVRAEDAPGPTLVVETGQLPGSALASRGELGALREALAGTPYARLNKIALYGPSARSGPDLDYRFVQALPDGGFDFRTGCGHSLLACVVASGRQGPVTVRAVTTGDVLHCTPEPPESPGPPGPPGLPGPPESPGPPGPPEPSESPGPPEPPEPWGSYTLRFLRPPDAPGTLPTGRPVDVLDEVPVSLVRYGNPYVFVDAAHLGIRTAEGLFRAGDDTLRRLLALRAHAARVLGYAPHSALPKIAAFTAGPGGTAVRALTVGGWHPRLALTGAAALSAAAALPGTVVPPLDGPVHTPGGTVAVSADPHGVAVHHKRATVLGRLELPWRIHATA
ncbi:PrpF domain-containing protein [Streptomyces sp. NPDC002992]|uniref:PrpF domain-containing protein n=1 Tax=Streptomyces sp. NPDC002992 TaxID=3154273 RepID=UPI0033ACA5F3